MKREKRTERVRTLPRPVAALTLVAGSVVFGSLAVGTATKGSYSLTSAAWAVEETKGLDAENQALLAAEAALLEKVNLSNIQAVPANPAPAGANLEGANLEGADLERTSLAVEPIPAVIPPSAEAAVAPAVEAPVIEAVPMPEVLTPEAIQPPVKIPVEAQKAVDPSAVEGVRAARLVEVPAGSVVPAVQQPKKTARAPKPNPSQDPAAVPGRAASTPQQPIQGGSGAAELETRLQAAHARNLRLMEALDDARRRLLAAETEIERLSSIVESRSSRYRGGAVDQGQQLRASNNGTSFPSATQAGRSQLTSAQLTPARSSNRIPAPAHGASSGRDGDMTVVTVTAVKANLRSGPGLNNSPLMTVPRGTRLVVERREGDWYRVVTPNGSRAWVTGAVVTFGAQDGWSPSSIVRVKSFDPNAEDAAFEFLQKEVGGGKPSGRSESEGEG